MFKVTAIYAALLGLLFLILSFNVIRNRRRTSVSLGDGGDASLLRAVRGHANFAEYVPIALVLMAVIEANGASSAFLHLFGVCLVAGRVMHGICFAFLEKNMPLRFGGTLLTFIALGIGVFGAFSVAFA